jgi:predicted membrane-bound mannosyltransferase
MEVVIWTLVFLGGSALIVIFLLSWAFKKDRDKLREVRGPAEDIE